MASIETPNYHSRALHWYSLRYPGREEEEAGVPMVKFSKQFEGQLVPEWKDAFVDYWQLKKDVKKLQAAGDSVTAAAVASSTSLCQTPAAAHWVMRLPFLHPHGHHKEPGAIQACTSLRTNLKSKRKLALKQLNDVRAIQVRKKLATDGSIDGAVAGEVYQTEVAEAVEFADTEAAKAFFVRLDQQLNKVNRFYERKESEFLERGESLRRQLQILVELKAAVTEQQQARQCGGSSADPEDPSVSCSILHGDQSLRGIIEQEQGEEKHTKDVFTTTIDHGGEDQEAVPQGLGDSGRLAKLREEHASKLRTFSGRSKRIGAQGGDVSEKLSITTKKLHQAGKMIRGALVELYKGLGYLRTYRTLNMMAFVKILKKFDKVTAKEVQPIYLRVVESSYFNSSDKAVRLMDDVEELFVRHFTEGDKRKAMKYLKPNQKEESHTTTFFIGLCTGGFVALFIGYCIMAHIAGMYTQQSNKVYMSTSYPVLRGYSSCAVQAIPGALLLVFLLILVCPFNIIYRSSRYHFLTVIRNIILTPFYKVVMVDFFMADQLCSQVPMLRSLEYLACYYITSSYRTQDYGYCTRVKHFRDLAYAVSFLPYYWRAMQCARRWFDEGDINHIVNLGKYVSAMLAAGTKVAYENNSSPGWLSLVIIVSSIATIYQLYWDFVKDWGLLQFNSKNTWLRNDLILKQKYIYFLSMGLNLVLRLAWLQTVIHPNIGSLDFRVTLFFLAALEVIRRGHWNFYRLENEHLNNAGKFRAVKVVPLPFHELEDS
ncbi:hypothetical protein PR202_gb17018 [Eleusine coracana subsp. coracana]|uniref:Uncharacterized protein n=1 Tax=Eleusine coracana subsp. coracana TaxID=191504 RepID=A0AAV5F3J9_ELECO|nr:hypothetical protein PR202_gb17018 [Eleusine coracana subsp. coracana]